MILAALLFAITVKPIETEVVIAAPVEAVWKAWTTTEGVKSFFAPDARVEARPGGAYEIFFDPKAPAGRRGADDMRVLVCEPMHRFAFTWNAPEQFPAARPQRTRVTLVFTPVDATHTRLSFTHDGFGDGGEWPAVRAYFDRAWNEIVLPRLVAKLEQK
ncbi:MAG TPA: SRPBCC domain-containing protein [Thermoanaerobaculia bacterium]|jgi:uncharacterized protein YndB with AHSA1/START domain